MRRLFANANYDFLSLRRKAYAGPGDRQTDAERLERMVEARSRQLMALQDAQEGPTSAREGRSPEWKNA